MDSRIIKWIGKGITTYSLISSSRGLRSFQYLIDNQNLEKQHFYRYLQLRHHLHRNIENKKVSEMSLFNIFIDVYKGSTHKKLESRIYLCSQSSKNHSTLYARDKWEKQANIAIMEEEWFNICETQSSTSSSGQWREFSWKNTIRFLLPREGHIYRAVDRVKGVAGENVIILWLIAITFFVDVQQSIPSLARDYIGNTFDYEAGD